MATTTITSLRGFPMQYPCEGRLLVQNITRAFLPGFPPSTLHDVSLEFRFNPIFILSSPMSAISFFSARLADVGPVIAREIALFACHQVRTRGWPGGLSLSVVLTTVYGLEQQQQQPPRRSPDFLESDEEFEDYELEDDDNVGMSDQEISLLSTERLAINAEEDEECCCSICLEGFRRGALITTLCPCSHKFHNGCIVPWLLNNRTCPLCRTICVSIP